MKNFRKNQGITLIALVITVIVLLILASVTIATLTGENGILNRAQEANNKTDQAEKDEKEKLVDMEDILNEYTTRIEVEQVADENPGVLEGSGTEADPYTINSIEDLVVFASNVTTGTTYEGQTVKLGLSLDFNSNKSYVEPLRTDYGQYGYDGELKTLLTSEEGFKPIGSSSAQQNNFFYGTFDGNNKDIYNLYIGMNINQSEDTDLGFFTSNYGIIKNANLKNVNIDISNVKNNITVAEGGISAKNNNTIINCYVSGNIVNKSKLWNIVGGICGVLETGATIEKCINEANILAENNNNMEGNAVAGGIVGQSSVNAGIINACCNNGNIKADSNANLNAIVGGIIGYSRGEVKNCYNTRNIEGYSNKSVKIGGIVGATSQMNISNCYNLGDIKAVGNNEIKIGGIEGLNYSNIITNVFNVGKIIVEGEDANNSFNIGGIACGEWNADISNGYNIGNISITNNTSENVGSIIGLRWNSTLTNCNYLKGTYSKGIGSFHSSSDTEEGVTELKDISDFPDILDVINVEGMFKKDSNNINKGYPILNWQ